MFIILYVFLSGTWYEKSSTLITTFIKANFYFVIWICNYSFFKLFFSFVYLFIINIYVSFSLLTLVQMSCIDRVTAFWLPQPQCCIVNHLWLKKDVLNILWRATAMYHKRNATVIRWFNVCFLVPLSPKTRLGIHSVYRLDSYREFFLSEIALFCFVAFIILKMYFVSLL